MKQGLAALVLVLFVGTLLVAQDSQSSAMSANAAASTGSTGAATESRSVAEQLRKLEDDWAKAMVDKNADRIRELEATDYVYVGSNGKVHNREQDLADLRDSTIAGFTNSDVQVRVYGDTAIVTGIAQIRGAEKGKDISGDYRYTDVFLKRNGTWQAVHTASTKMQP